MEIHPGHLEKERRTVKLLKKEVVKFKKEEADLSQIISAGEEERQAINAKLSSVITNNPDETEKATVTKLSDELGPVLVKIASAEEKLEELRAANPEIVRDISIEKDSSARKKKAVETVKHIGKKGARKAKEVGRQGVVTAAEISQEGIRAGKRGINLMAEGQARSVNPERNMLFTPIEPIVRPEKESRIRKIGEWIKNKMDGREKPQPELEPAKDEEKQIEREIKAMPKADREKLGFGLNRIGFSVEQKKNEFFARTFNWVAETNLDQNKATTKWLRQLAVVFDRDAEIAYKKAKDDKEGKEKHEFQNAARLVANVARYGRIAADVLGHTAALPLRYVMMAAMATNRGAEAAKEVRFQNPELINQTRTGVDKESIDLATKEAWEIYEHAQYLARKKGEENVTVEELKNGYLAGMPQDLKKRLEKPEVAYGVMQGLFQKQINFSINRMNRLLDEIDSNSDLTKTEQESKKQRLLKKWEKSLADYDRALTQAGTIDELAMYARYVQKGATGVVYATTIQTILVAGEKMLGPAWRAMVDSHDHGVLAVVKDSLHFTNTPTKDFLNSALSHKVGDAPIKIPDIKMPNIDLREDFTNTPTKDFLNSALYHNSPTHPVGLSDKGVGDGMLKDIHDKIDGALRAKQDGSAIRIPDHPRVGGKFEDMFPHSEKAVEVTQGAPELNLEQAAKVTEMGSVWDHPVDIEIKGPGGLEHAYEKLVLDLTLPEKLPEGVILNGEGATRALNEAANLVKLTEGHNVAGINAAEFAKAVKLENGKLSIDSDQFHKFWLVLHEHSGENAKSGIFKDPESASKYIKNVDWLEKVQAKDLHAIYSDIGHPEATAGQIESFGGIPKPSAEAIEEARARVMEAVDGSIRVTSPGQPEVYNGPMENIPEGKALSAEDLIRYHEPQTPNPEHLVNTGAEKPVTAPASPADSVNSVGEIAKTPDYLSEEMLKEVAKISKENIHHFFPNNTDEAWKALRIFSAADLIIVKDGGENLMPFVGYLVKLRDLTEGAVQPITANPALGRAAETNEEFIKRALEYIALHSPEKLDKLKY